MCDFGSVYRYTLVELHSMWQKHNIGYGQRLLNSTRFLIGKAKRTGNPQLMFTDPDVPIGYK